MGGRGDPDLRKGAFGTDRQRCHTVTNTASWHSDTSAGRCRRLPPNLGHTVTDTVTSRCL